VISGMMAAALVAVSMLAGAAAYRLLFRAREDRFLKEAFRRYVDGDVLEQLLAHPERLRLGGEERELTVLFVDIRGFTSVSQKLSPQLLVQVLTEYLETMTGIILAHRGTIDKYIGDAVMAFFGAPVANPRHALDCCAAALEMVQAVERLQAKWRAEAPSLPDVRIAVGIHSGPMVVGNFGSSRRFVYTVMGEHVNLASRVQGMGKHFGTSILVSETTLELARAALAASGGEPLAVREVDAVRVKGRDGQVRLFEVRGTGACPQDAPLLAAYAAGLEHYRAARFTEAHRSFEECLRLAPGDGPSLKLAARCAELRERPVGLRSEG
jgi:adenylate cyclase